jgi:hypothetical protein
MKTFATLALAGAIAATSLATTATTADAGGKHWKQNKYNNYHHGKNYSKGWNPGGALAAGALLGFAFGALATPNYYYAPPPRVYYPPPPPTAYPAYPAYGYAVGPQASSRHVDWCYSRYKSYNVQRNSWVGYDGYVHQCISPFPY